MFSSTPGVVHVRVEDRAALAAGAGDDEHVDTLGDVHRHGRRALARLVVGMGMDGHQPQPLGHRSSCRSSIRLAVRDLARGTIAAMTDQAFRPPAERPADRYGDRPPTPATRRSCSPSAVGSLAGRGWPGGSGSRVVQSNPPVRYELLGFDAVNATSVEIRFSVAARTGVTGRLRAPRARVRRAEVGRRQVVVPAETAERDRPDQHGADDRHRGHRRGPGCAAVRRRRPGASPARLTPQLRTRNVADLLP